MPDRPTSELIQTAAVPSIQESSRPNTASGDGFRSLPSDLAGRTKTGYLELLLPMLKMIQVGLFVIPTIVVVFLSWLAFHFALCLLVGTSRYLGVLSRLIEIKDLTRLQRIENWAADRLRSGAHSCLFYMRVRARVAVVGA